MVQVLMFHLGRSLCPVLLLEVLHKRLLLLLREQLQKHELFQLLCHYLEQKVMRYLLEGCLHQLRQLHRLLHLLLTLREQ
jgi:hypothetical protein